MNTGTYIEPDRSKCAHCGAIFGSVMTNGYMVRSYSMAAIRILNGAEPDVVYLLCSVCTLDLGEFVEPSLKEDPEWRQSRESLTRAIRAADN